MSDVLLAVPNISEGRDDATITRIAGTTALLDVGSDRDHNRSVLTYGGDPDTVLDAVFTMVERAVTKLDITTHDGVHPRFGVVDVLPFVPYPMDEDALRERISELTWRIAQGPGIPVLTYGRASPDNRTLPELRKQLRDDPPVPHPTAGVICLGIRDPLIAFNVNCLGDAAAARSVAREIRAMPGVRALGLDLASRGEVQISMNLTDLTRTGPAQAFERVIDVAREHSLQVIDAEVAGLVPESVMSQIRRLPLRWFVRTIEERLSAGRVGP